jgi:hypothetical protein
VQKVNEMALIDIVRDRYRHQPNILIVGSEPVAELALQGLSPLFTGPTHTCVLPGPLDLPRAGCSALILRNVDALNTEQQAELWRWLESGVQVPVVSVSSSSVFPLVTSGNFSARLYYRLNIILEDATRRQPEPARR